jgi:hypothetical protein
MLNLFSFCFMLLVGMLGCTEPKVNDNVEDDVSTEERPDYSEPETTPEPGIVFEPDLMFFYATSVVDIDSELDCFVDGGGATYCGVFRFIMVNFDEWEGLDDTAHSCHIRHKIDPAYVVQNGVETTFTDNGDWIGWEFDASQSLVDTSLMCDFIQEDHPGFQLLDQLKTNNFSLGYGPIDGEMAESFKTYVDQWSAEDEGNPTWEELYAPNLISQTVVLGDKHWRPNFAFAFERDENGVPVVADSQYQPIQMNEATGLVNAFYRCKTWYGFDIDKFLE